MKKSTKLIAMLTVITLLSGLLAVAVADDKIYTSPTFKVPKDRVELPVEQPEEEPTETPDETEEPEATPETPAEEGTEPEQQEQPDQPEQPEGTVERKVIITSSRKDSVIRDQFITLYSELIGFDDVEPHYQWQVDRGDGNGWVDVEGATGTTHSFVATPETVLYNWRLLISVDE